MDRNEILNMYNKYSVSKKAQREEKVNQVNDVISNHFKNVLSIEKAKNNCSAFMVSLKKKVINPTTILVQKASGKTEKEFYKKYFGNENIPLTRKDEINMATSLLSPYSNSCHSLCKIPSLDFFCNDCPFRTSSKRFEELFFLENNSSSKYDKYEVPKFPLKTLPVTLQDLIKTISENINCPKEYTAVCTLAVLASVMGINFKVYFSDTWEIYSNIIIVMVGEPSAKKSPPMKFLTKLLNDVEEEVNINICVSNTTVEGLCSFVEENNKSVLIASDELLAFINSIGEYKHGNNSDRQFYLSAWNCSKMVICRKTNGNMTIPKMHVNILGGVQPKVLKEKWSCLNNGDGFAERILFTIPYDYKDVIKYIPRGKTPLNKDVVMKFKVIISELLKYNEHKEYFLDDIGDKILSDFETEIAQMTVDNPNYASMYGKITVLSGKFALIFQVFEDFETRNYVNTYISENNIKNGVLLAKYFLNQFIWISENLNSNSSENISLEDKVYKWLLSKFKDVDTFEAIVPSILSKNHVGNINNASKATEILDNLVSEGRVYKDNVENKYYIIK